MANITWKVNLSLQIKINTKANICNFGLPAFLFVANVPLNLYNI